MSTSMIQSKIKRQKDNINDLKRKYSREHEKEAKAGKDLLRAKKELSKTKNASSQRSKTSKIERLEKNRQAASEEKSKLYSKIQKAESTLGDYERQLLKEQTKEAKRLDRLSDDRETTITNGQKEIQNKLDLLKDRTQRLLQGDTDNTTNSFYVFISHATEDKDDLVRPLSEKLESEGLSVFYDEKVFKIGDSKANTINQGILNSKFGLVILSPNFINKPWPKYEYTGFLTREMEEEKKVILPIWHNITGDEVFQFSPNLYDTFALISSEESIESMADQIIEIIQPN